MNNGDKNIYRVEYKKRWSVSAGHEWMAHESYNFFKPPEYL